MTLSERIDKFYTLFNNLLSTNSILEKRYYINKLDKELSDDFKYIVECLNGIHKFGFTYYNTKRYGLDKIDKENWTVRQLLEFLQEPMQQHDLSMDNIFYYVSETSKYEEFVEPIVNRTLKLGIGKSLFSKTSLSPMLAKKFEGVIPDDRNGYYVTEKLDGNRCIAHYEEDGWHFTSRNGRELKVSFDMGDLDKSIIYDGEILSPEQTTLSVAINEYLSTDKVGNFNTTSGVINSLAKDKDLIYNIFDIIIPDNETAWPYKRRRMYLDNLSPDNYGYNVRILPVLDYYDIKEVFLDKINKHLDYVTRQGGEGVMINLGSGIYEHKRTNLLLKFKKIQTIDMKVIGIEYGTGKYEGQIGSLVCEARTDDGKYIFTKVGSGLDDVQRYNWSLNIYQIIGKIVEIEYFSLSQDTIKRTTNEYSLRFPRLKQVRYDKDTTSEY